jgi:hypothetical protein
MIRERALFEPGLFSSREHTRDRYRSANFGLSGLSYHLEVELLLKSFLLHLTRKFSGEHTGCCALTSKLARGSIFAWLRRYIGATVSLNARNCWRRSILERLFRRPIGFNQILNFCRIIGPQGCPDGLNRTAIASQNEMLGG